MTADLLTRAATKARGLAQAATPGPWEAAPGPWRGPDHRVIERVNAAEGDRAVIPAGYALPVDAEHIAAWDPTAALAAAGLLSSLASAWRLAGAPPAGAIAACQLARHLLGEDT